MNPKIEHMLSTWNSLVISTRNRSEKALADFSELLSEVFSIGPFYHYVIDFVDMSICQVSDSIAEAHSLAAKHVNHISQVLALIHPDDMAFVTAAEKKTYHYIFDILGKEKLLRYKISYNFRMKDRYGRYRLFNHQAVVLTVDEHGNFVNSLNIHTDISHLAEAPNYKLSLIGLGGEPSYLNLEISPEEAADEAETHRFSPRELDIIRLISKGLSNKQMAEMLNISEHTVKTHRKNIQRKSGCNNATELIARSVNEGWI